MLHSSLHSSTVHRAFVLLLSLFSLTSSAAMSLSEQAVASHYEQFPYPPVDNILSTEIPTFFGTSLFELNYFLWGGRRKFTKTGLNILIAGGGTSQMTAVVAHMLQEHRVPGMVVHLDLSLNSIALAREHVSTQSAWVFYTVSLLSRDHCSMCPRTNLPCNMHRRVLISSFLLVFYII